MKQFGLVAALVATTLLASAEATTRRIRASITTNGVTEGTLISWDPSTGQIDFWEHTWKPSITKHSCFADGSFSTPGSRCSVQTNASGQPELITVTGTKNITVTTE